MINFEPRRLDPDDFWIEGPRRFGSATGTNMRIGRSTYGILRRLGLSNISLITSLSIRSGYLARRSRRSGGLA